MKRGIIRIISGVVLLVLQFIGIDGLRSGNGNISGDFWTYVGFYSPAIVGIVLIVFGRRAYKNNICSRLVLHSKSKKIHNVIRWISFAVSTLLCATYLLTFIASFADFDVYRLLMMFSTLAFCVYTLCYMYKKPSCLFSTALIFLGVAYIYDIISNFVDYLLALTQYDFFVYFVWLRMIPKFIAGILYIVVAVKIYKENFSPKVIRFFGLTIFALELSSRLIYGLVVGAFRLMYLDDLFMLLFVGILMLYMCVFHLNTLRESKGTFSDPIVICNRILFCRKCGEKLADNGRFCPKCGTEVVNTEKERAYEVYKM